METILMMKAPPNTPARSTNATYTGFTPAHLPCSTGCAGARPGYCGKMKSSQPDDPLPRGNLDWTGADRSGNGAGAHGGSHRHRIPAVHPRSRRVRPHHDRVHQLARGASLPRCAQTEQDSEISCV